MSPKELDTIKQYLGFHLAIKFFQASLVSYLLPILSIKKLGGGI